VKAGSGFEGLAILGQSGASLRDDGFEGDDVGDVFVDDGFVDARPKRLGGLKLGRVGG